MNAITHYAAYSLYPKGTFEKGVMLPCDTREINHDPGLAKYKARGYMALFPLNTLIVFC